MCFMGRVTKTSLRLQSSQHFLFGSQAEAGLNLRLNYIGDFSVLIGDWFMLGQWLFLESTTTGNDRLKY